MKALSVVRDDWVLVRVLPASAVSGLDFPIKRISVSTLSNLSSFQRCLCLLEGMQIWM